LKLIALTLAATAGVAAAVAAAAPPIADAPGLVVSQNGRIYVGGHPIARGTHPVWSPDGTRIAYHRLGEIYVADADGKKERRLTTTSQPVHSPAWSPDGRTIAFGGVRDVFTVPSRGGAVRNVTRSPKPWLLRTSPAYSPDGRVLAISAATDAFNSDIFLIRVDGKVLRRLTRTHGTHDRFAEESMPSFSPDGKRVVYVSNRDRSFDLYSIGVDGTGERRLTRTPGQDEMHPRYSRDGKRILYAHEGRLAHIRATGGDVRELGLGTSADWR
jgi:Tol biopolymer transport system component